MKKNLYIVREIPNIRSIIKFFLTAFILTMFMTTAHAEKKFKFENYKTAEEAKTELLRRHPIGSNVDALFETLKEAGAKVEKINVSLHPEGYDLHKKDSQLYHYSKSKSRLMFLWWIGRIEYSESDNSIIEHGVSIVYDGL